MYIWRTLSFPEIHFMKKVDLSNPHRKKHFEFFNSMSNPHFNITSPADITGLREIRDAGSLNTRIVYLLSRAAHDVPEFRQRIRGKEVVEHQMVHPSFTVPTEESEVFSFCTVEYDPRYREFRQRAEAEIERMRVAPSFEDEPGRDDYLFMSAIPWLPFTSIQHAMDYTAPDSVPRLSWGKFYEAGDRLMMPLSVQVHHALLDARHVARFYERFEELVAQAARVLSE